MPIGDMQPVTQAQRMMTTRLHVFAPRILLAAGRVLPRKPPPPSFLRPRRVLQVEDHDEVANIAVRSRRNVGIAAIEVEAMNAGATCLPLVDQTRSCGTRDIIEPKPAAERWIATLPLLLVVDDHQAIARAYLVRVPAGRHLDVREETWPGRVGHVVDRGAGRRTHVRNKQRGAVDPHLAAARTIDERNKLRVQGTRHYGS